MTKVTLLTDDSTPLPTPENAAPKTISFPLTGQPGEAIFRIPTIGNAIAVQSRFPNISQADFCRKMAEDALVSWGGESSMPIDSEIDIADDFAILELFASDTSGGAFEVCVDKSHEVITALGAIAFRRPTRVDVRKVDQLNAQVRSGKIGTILSDLMWACDLTTDWWQSGRKIMSGDFNELPLSDYLNIQAALAAFFPRRTTSI